MNKNFSYFASNCVPLCALTKIDSIFPGFSAQSTITSAKDLYLIKAEETKINFISNKSIISKLKEFKKTNKNENLECVICIENADPGYDFLFSKNIKGLITKYGGQNSHMAIRCAELNLPALIGVGENLYREITNSKTIKIDCELKKIELIN